MKGCIPVMVRMQYNMIFALLMNATVSVPKIPSKDKVMDLVVVKRVSPGSAASIAGLRKVPTDYFVLALVLVPKIYVIFRETL